MSLSGSSSTSPPSGSSSISAEPRRLRIVTISDFVLTSLLAGGRPDVYVTSDWPEDAHIVDARMDFDRRALELCVWSSTFDEAPAGSVLPRWDPVFTDHYSDLGEVADAMRRERIEMTLDEGLRP